MDPRLQRRVQRYGWDRAAAYYEQYWRRQLEPAQQLLLRMADIRPGDRVLDVACGTGLVTLPAAERVAPEGEVVATDISGEMVERVRTLAAGRGTARVRAERMDAEDLRFPDASFDVVLCALGLMYVPDPLKALREMRRVLRAGGRAVMAVWGARDRCGWAEVFPIVDSRVDSEVCPLFFQLGTLDSLARAMREAGFDDVVSERISSTLSYGSADDAVGAAFAGGPVALAYARFDDSTRHDAHAEYLASIVSYRSGDGYEIPGEFVVAAGLASA